MRGLTCGCLGHGFDVVVVVVCVRILHWSMLLTVYLCLGEGDGGDSCVGGRGSSGDLGHHDDVQMMVEQTM